MRASSASASEKGLTEEESLPYVTTLGIFHNNCNVHSPFFFCLNAAWLNEGRCPGGRPSVSEN